MSGNAGRPPYEPTAEWANVVQVMHANGIPHRLIAKALGIAEKTLRKHYKEVLRDAHLQVEAAMGAVIVQAAQRGAWGAARYWLQVNAGARWRVADRHIISGDPDAAPAHVPMDVRAMTDGEIAAELAAIRQRRATSAASPRD